MTKRNPKTSAGEKEARKLFTNNTLRITAHAQSIQLNYKLNHHKQISKHNREII